MLSKICSNVYSNKHTCRKTGHTPIEQPIERFVNKDGRTCLDCRLVTREAGRQARLASPKQLRHIIVRHIPIVPGDDPKFVDEGHRRGFEMWLGNIVQLVKNSSCKY